MAITQRPQSAARTVRAEKSQASAATTGTVPPTEKIAARAYQIWQESGCPEGKQEEHWLRAERELRADAQRR